MVDNAKINVHAMTEKSRKLIMETLVYIAYFFGGIFFANAIPHLVSGITGRTFQSPFAKPPGKGLSSSTVNILWAYINLVISYILILHVGNFNLHSVWHVLSAALGAFLVSLRLAHVFGKLHGGNI